jgi:hypothetical protein
MGVSVVNLTEITGLFFRLVKLKLTQQNYVAVAHLTSACEVLSSNTGQESATVV